MPDYYRGDAVLGQRIKALRKERGLTQQQLGDMINVTKVSICCYENGTRTPTLDTLIDLANELNVELIYFLGIDHYQVASDDITYGLNVAKDELKLIQELRKHHSLYNKLLENTKRTIELIEKKIR